MACLRSDLKQKLTAFAHNELPPDSRKEVELHLENCNECRSRLSGITDVDRILGSMSRLSAPPDSLQKIEANVMKKARSSHVSSFYKEIAVVAAALLAGFLLFAIWNRTDLRNQKFESEFDPKEFQSVSLSQFPKSVEPHVATEGYVQKMTVKDEEGDVKFRLVDDLNRPNHFVVCEIIEPFTMEPPPDGSRVRVYGVSRYDAKAQHGWFEVHPVLNIEPIR
jgi:hypothetical protein